MSEKKAAHSLEMLSKFTPLFLHKQLTSDTKLLPQEYRHVKE